MSTAPTTSTVPGPVPGTQLTEAYVGAIARLAYLWAWPMVNMHNRAAAVEVFPEPGLVGGILPQAPPNQLAMLTDYITPDQKIVACPNQDVAYGAGLLRTDGEPTVVQVPDFGNRFWVYQILDQRTDSFVELGAMYQTKPGCYLVVGTAWDGRVPDGIVGVLRCPTTVAGCFPRVFLNDTDQDRAAIQPIINQIAMYPLSHFDGTPKTVDWKGVRIYPAPETGQGEVRFVFPERFAADLRAVLSEVPPLPGEDALYALLASVLDAVAAADDLQASRPSTSTATWTATVAGSTAPTATGVTFAAGQLPPVQGFWSLTLYNEHHFFHPNQLARYSLGTKNTGLVYSEDGSLTLYAQSDPPPDETVANWLPAPEGDFTLYLRAYWPGAAILDGTWTPPITRTT